MGRRSGISFVVLAVLTAGAALPGSALAHPERPSDFPDGSGKFPRYRTTGPAEVVCKPDSRARINAIRGGRRADALRRANLRLLRRCRHEHIQQAVNAASNGDRVLILPGVYREEPSRNVPNPDPACKDFYVKAAGRDRLTPTYEYEVKCPNSRNLVAILGDSLEDPDRRCDRKCDLQIEGTGRRRDVLVVGDRRKENVFKADRADGVYFRNMTVQYSDYNNFYVLETDGFRFSRITSRWSKEYGFLSFVSDHGIYEHLNTYGHGDAGVYPGSGPELFGRRYGIHIRYVNSHDNLQGNSGSAGNSLWYYKNRFHHNGLGVVVDSFSTGHPGGPQDHAKWTDNRIYSNNLDLFSAERDEYCKRPVLQRDPKVVCPAIMVPIGTGLLIAAGNNNVVRDNWIYDNRRNGAMQFWVPSTFRGEDDPAKQNDTSHFNRYTDNHMGVTPTGRRSPNGTDFWWDEQGEGNCWQDNRAAADRRITGDPDRLPRCPGASEKRPVNDDKFATLVPCATWDPLTNTDPAGCDWFTIPPRRR